ncbi:MAG TPA: sigma-70 family RNA polymerase sigma factor, partial [Deltaproteobacteria bacterium]|nr:sigma-70 family RNA polymerase sigma factor [Deltaproteobacteria bacterium]
YKVLTAEEELDLAYRYRDGDEKAGHMIILSNMRFARKIAHRYFHLVDDPSEIIQNANLGLVKALTRFDPDVGVRFISYAIWWVKAYIKNHINKSYKVHTGSLADSNNLVSLDCSISHDTDTEETMLDSLSYDGPDQNELYTYKERGAFLRNLLRSDPPILTDREAFIIECRFLNEPPATLKDISSKIGVTRERVRQIQVRSLEKIRNAILKCGSIKTEDITINQGYSIRRRVSF